MEVLFEGVLWHQDAAHLGRTASGETQGQVLRDAAQKDVLTATVGGVVSGQDAVLAFEAAADDAGAPPLVHATDNGPPHTSAPFGEPPSRCQPVN